MFFIVVYHFFIHGLMHQHTTPELGFFITANSSLTEIVNFIIAQTLIVGVSTGVNLFVMISGYFLICKKEFRTKSLIRLWIKVAFYSVSIALLFLVVGKGSLIGTIMSLFPLSTNQYWFMLPYFGLMLLAPFIARLICELGQRQYLTFLFFLFAINFIVPFGRIMGGGNLSWFVFLFCFAGYLKLYPIVIRNLKILLLLTILVATIFFVLFPVIMSFAHDFQIDNSEPFYLQEPMYNGLCFFVSALIFISVANSKLKTTKYANLISIFSTSTLGVYLIHDNRLVRNLIWEQLLDLSTYSSSLFIWVVLILVCTVIFGLTIAVDVVIERLFKFLKPEDLLYENVYKPIKNRINEFKI